jgi:prefoldin subunit 5
MSDLLSQLEVRITQAEKEFHDKGERIGVLSEQRASIDREIQKLQAEQLELRGAYQELKKLRDAQTPEEPQVN